MVKGVKKKIFIKEKKKKNKIPQSDDTSPISTNSNPENPHICEKLSSFSLYFPNFFWECLRLCNFLQKMAHFCTNSKVRLWIFGGFFVKFWQAYVFFILFCRPCKSISYMLNLIHNLILYSWCAYVVSFYCFFFLSSHKNDLIVLLWSLHICPYSLSFSRFYESF